MQRLLVLAACLLGGWACSSSPPAPPAESAPAVTVFEGARLIVGDGSDPIERSAFIVQDRSFVQVGRQGELQVPTGARRVDLTGKTVMPVLIDAHSHLGYTNVKAMTTSAANYTRENLVDHLRRYAYYGILGTLSMGVDRGELPHELRANQVPGAARFRSNPAGSSNCPAKHRAACGLWSA